MNTKDTHIVFMGTPPLAATILQSLIDAHYTIDLVVTNPDRSKGRSKALEPSAVATLSAASNLQVLKSANKDELTSGIKGFKPDIIIVAAYGMLIPESILELPRLGAINVHGSILPKYRGASPIASSILEGDEETGATLIYMTKDLDAGDIIAHNSFPIAPDETTASLTQKMAIEGGNLLIQTLPEIIEGTASRTQQDNTKATYHQKITKADGQISWKESAEVIERKVRAYNPWPGAYTNLGNKTIKIGKTKFSADNPSLTPGEIKIADKRMFVGTANSSLEILQLQPEGKRMMPARDFLNSNQDLNGKYLDR